MSSCTLARSGALHGAVVLAVLASCALPVRDDGAACESSDDCGELECVELSVGGVCLPIPERAPASCAEDVDCANALFPVEASCQDGLCRCDIERECDGGTFDPLVCACVDELSEFCAVDENCANEGLHCEEGRCQSGDEPGEPCISSEPCEGPLVRDGCFCPPDDIGCSIGQCFADAGNPCDERDDCISTAPNCVNGECSPNGGSEGSACTTGDDCISGFCIDTCA